MRQIVWCIAKRSRTAVKRCEDGFFVFTGVCQIGAALIK